MRLHPNAKTPSSSRALLVRRIQRKRWSASETARAFGISARTVYTWLHRYRSEGRRRLHDRPSRPLPIPHRTPERPRAGDLLHLDIKKLGRFREVGHRVTGRPHDRNRGIGWEFAYVCIDDATRLAYVEILDKEQAISAQGFLRRAVAWYRRQGVHARRVMIDNGSPFVSRLFAQA